MTRILPRILSLAAVLAVSGCSSQFEKGYAARQENKDNSPAAGESSPMVHTVSSNFSRIIVCRLKYGTDLLDGLQKAVKQENIKNAVILSGVGSLTSYRVHVVDSTTFPVKEAFPKAEGPQDLLNVNGYVIDGRVHAHVIFSDQTKAMGGHLEPGTNVYTFAIITLGILPNGVSLARFDDSKW
jgi:hypothetical protein